MQQTSLQSSHMPGEKSGDVPNSFEQRQLKGLVGRSG